MEHKKYQIALGMLPGIGGNLSKLLVSYCGSAEKVFSTPKGKLKQIPGIGNVLAEAIIQGKAILPLAEKQVAKATAQNAHILFYTDKAYPERLRHIHNAPSLLYYKGKNMLNAPKIIGIVGTREATSYGKDMVSKIIGDLASFNPIIISGLAYGIDITAHTAALQHGLETIGVMASGLNIIYPKEHKQIAEKMTAAGGLITEYPYDTKPEPARFPARNRIIAGMCDGLIVVEAAKKGGALITAEMANDYNREVFAVPGDIGNRYSEGCNKLIATHKAHIFSDSSELVKMLNWDIEGIKPSKKLLMDLESLPQGQKEVVVALSEHKTLTVEDLSWRSQTPLSKLASVLLELELKGIIKNLPGNKYKLV